MTQISTSSRMSNLFQLEYPQSVGLYDTYEEAQRVVDFLADSKFPVENICIVGTELRSVERVLGRRTWATVLSAGLQNGLTTGLLVAMLMWFLQPEANIVALFIYGLGMGLVIGVLVSVFAHLMSRGRRDFTSVSQTVATKYEILAEHKVVAQARQLVMTMPGARAAMFVPPQPPAGYGYPQGYPQPGYPAAGYPSGYPAAPVPAQTAAPEQQPAAPAAPDQSGVEQPPAEQQPPQA